jgi:Ca2+-binding RTX toxin-like protein
LGAPSGVTVDFRLTTQSIGGGTITGIENISWVQGSNFDDVLNVSSNNNNGYSDFTAVFGMGGNDQLTAGYYTGYMDGGDGDDIVDGRGSQYLQEVIGGAGNDILYTATNGFGKASGGDGNDRIFAHGNIDGGAGDDYIEIQFSYYGDTAFGGAGDDEIRGSSGNATIAGGSGADLIVGGVSNDRLGSGEFAPHPAILADDLGLEQDSLSGGGGDDLLSGGYGDNLDGGSGNDTLRLSLAGLASGIDFSTAGLSSGQAVTVGGGTIQNIETLSHLRGTEFSDIFRLATQDSLLELNAGAGDDVVFTGGSSAKVFGGDGNDRFVSGIAGDIFDGGSGSDTIDYSAYASAVTVNLAATSANGSGAGGDQLINIEHVLGTAFGDTLTGNELANQVRGGEGSDSIGGGAGNDALYGDAGNDVIAGGDGADLIEGGGGQDSVRGGSGRDTFRDTAAGLNGDTILDFSSDDKIIISDANLASFSFSLTGNTLTYSGGSLTLSALPSGPLMASAAVGGGVQLSVATQVFRPAGAPVINDFNPARGWTSQDQFARHVADLNGDGYTDIVGFGIAGVLVSYGSAGGTFSAAGLALADFGQNSGWSSDNQFHRALADINGDGRADIIGFGFAGTLVSVAKADGSFGVVTTGIADFGRDQGWASQDRFARLVGDVNGDGKADIVGFGFAGTLVGLGNGDGTFQAAKTGLADFGVNQGWTSDNLFHRALSDVNGDGKADLVGFGIAGTYVAVSNGDGTFADAKLQLRDFGTSQGWSNDDSFQRIVTDVNGDRFADIVGFTNGGTMIAFGKGDGSFHPVRMDVSDFGRNQGWTSDNLYHRAIADMNNDGLADIVGFGINGTLIGLNSPTFL